MSATPIFITGVEPLNTGKGILRLKLIPVLFPTGPKEISLDIRIIHHHDAYLVAIAKELAGNEHTLILEPISFEWLEKHCPSVHKKMMSNWWKPETIQQGLEYRYGETDSRILHTASPLDCPAGKKLHPMPKKHTTVNLNREFSEYESYLISKGVIPASDDDKWFIFRQGESLYFHHSWSGYCLYEVVLQMREGRIYFSYCKINRNPKQYGGKNDDYDLAMINWLVDELLLGKESQLPIEPEFIDEDDGEEG